MQDTMDDSMPSGVFGDTFSADRLGILCKDALKHTHSLPGPLSATDNKSRGLSPMGRTYSGALQARSLLATYPASVSLSLH